MPGGGFHTGKGRHSLSLTLSSRALRVSERARSPVPSRPVSAHSCARVVYTRADVSAVTFVRTPVSVL